MPGCPRGLLPADLHPNEQMQLSVSIHQCRVIAKDRSRVFFPFFFWFIHTRIQPTYLGYGGALSISVIRAMIAARCKLPFALRPGPSQDDAHQGNHKGKESEQKEEQRKPYPAP